jgi:cholesterol oxidase
MSHYDAIVIGSGFGGSVSALRLRREGVLASSVLEKRQALRAQRLSPRPTGTSRSADLAPGAAVLRHLQASRSSPHVFVLSAARASAAARSSTRTPFTCPRSGSFRRAPGPRSKDWKSALAPHYAHRAVRMLGVTQNTFEGEADEVLKDDRQARWASGDTYVRTPVAVYFGEPGKRAPDPFFGGKGPERSGCNALRRLHGGLPLRREEHARQELPVFRRAARRRRSSAETEVTCRPP